jgi:hypothetical protein
MKEATPTFFNRDTSATSPSRPLRKKIIIAAVLVILLAAGVYALVAVTAPTSTADVDNRKGAPADPGTLSMTSGNAGSQAQLSTQAAAAAVSTHADIPSAPSVTEGPGSGKATTSQPQALQNATQPVQQLVNTTQGVVQNLQADLTQKKLLGL